MKAVPQMPPSILLPQHQTAVWPDFLFFPFQFWLFAFIFIFYGKKYTSTGGAGICFGLCWPVLDAVTTNPMAGMYKLLSWVGRVRFSDDLEELVGRSLKVPNGGLRIIDGCIAVDACVKFPYLAKFCCYWKYVSTRRYVLTDENSIYGISFLLVIY